MNYVFNPFGGTLVPIAVADTRFSAVYTLAPGSNTINLGTLVLPSGVFPDESSLANRMSLAIGSTSYNLGNLT